MTSTREASRAGYSLLELMFALGLSATISAAAAPQLLSSVDDVRAAGAVRFLSARLQQVRMEAIARSADVALQFSQAAGGYTYAVYIDGNGDGVRTTDIQRGVDLQIMAADRLSDHFAGVDFGVLPALPPVDRGGSPPGADPIKLGSSNILTFTPLGTATPGSLYVRGRRDLQYVIRIFGETGKTRTLKFDVQRKLWTPL